MTSPLNVAEYRNLARRRLPRGIFDFIDGGADDEKGIAHNRAIFDRLRFRPRRFVDASTRDLTTHLFGRRLAAPIMIAPTGLTGVVRPHGDIALARAAAAAGIPFILSTASSSSIEEVAGASCGERWFQLYMVDRDLADSLIGRAEAAGYSTLVVTVDVPMHSNRERDRRSGFGLPIRFTPRLLLDGISHPLWSIDFLRHGVPQLANFRNSGATTVGSQEQKMRKTMDSRFDWQALRALRKRWPHPLLVKGIMHPDDAVRCLEEGADGIILSNHGGRQLDHCLSPLEILAETRVKSRAPILIDSGFRRGSDIVKALALGADAVLLGRATLYGLAARGETGVIDVLRLLQAEIDCTMAQLGCGSVSQLSPDYLVEEHQSQLAPTRDHPFHARPTARLSL